MRDSVNEIPIDTLQLRYPQWTHTVTINPSQGTSFAVPGRTTPPRQHYDPSNPRWSGQGVNSRIHPRTNKAKFYSTWQPHVEYRHHQCNFCKLYRHIQWNCPQYACQHCKKACGHKPHQCPKNPRHHDGTNSPPSYQQVALINVTRAQRMREAQRDRVVKKTPETSARILAQHP